MRLEGSPLSIEGACRAAQVSRAGYYRYFDQQAPRPAETELRDKVQRVALEPLLRISTRDGRFAASGRHR